MRRSDSPYLADWFAISLRWVILMGILSSLAYLRQLTWYLIVTIGLAIAWNLSVSILAMFNRRLNGHRVINIMADLVFSVTLFLLSGGLSGPLLWVGLMVMISSALYYEWRGAVISAVVVAVTMDVWIYFTSIRHPGIAVFLATGLGVLAVGGLLSVMSAQLMRRLRRNYQIMLNQRRQSEKNLQRQERDKLQMFYQMIETLSTTLNYQVVLDTTLDLSTNALGESDPQVMQLTSAVLLFAEQGLRIEAFRKMPAPDSKQTFAAEIGALAQVIKTGEPYLVDNPSQDPELERLLVLHSCQVALLLPLRRGLNAFGVMLYAHPDTNFFNQERAELLEMVSHQAVIAIQNARLFHEAQIEASRMAESQEETRKKLARDLHDGPTQSVSAIAMRINVARKILETDPLEAAHELVKIEDLARRTTQEIRHMLFTLRPLVLESEGLNAALIAMADKMRDTYQQNVLVEIDPATIDRLEIGKQTVMFYVIEEAVNNARKHALAAHIWVRFKPYHRDASIGMLEIVDDGVGFDLEAVNSSYERRGSLGMVNLRERTDLISGVLHIRSTKGKGTRVVVLIPLNEEAADRLQRGLTAN